MRSWVVPGVGAYSAVHKPSLGAVYGDMRQSRLAFSVWSSELCHPARLQVFASLPQNDPKAPLPEETQIFPFAHS